MDRNGAEILLDALVACGVDTVLVRHEQAAVHAAEGYARSTGRLGVVLVTSGPGVGNTITGLLYAMSDSIPLLCISGQVASGVIGTQAFQKCDALGISRPVTKWHHQPRDAAQVADGGARGGTHRPFRSTRPGARCCWTCRRTCSCNASMC